MKTELFLHHIDYTAWASRRLLEAASSLSPDELNRDFGTADKSVLGTLVHVFAADRVWYARVTGKPRATFIDPEDRSLAVLQQEWPKVLAAWRELIASTGMETVVDYKDLKGNPYASPLWQIVLHMVNHGTHHRGQASGMIRAMGHTPPPLDLIAYYRQLR